MSAKIAPALTTPAARMRRSGRAVGGSFGWLAKVLTLFGYFVIGGSDEPRTRPERLARNCLFIEGDKARTPIPGPYLCMMDGPAADTIQHEAAGI